MYLNDSLERYYKKVLRKLSKDKKLKCLSPLTCSTSSGLVYLPCKNCTNCKKKLEILNKEVEMFKIKSVRKNSRRTRKLWR